MSLPWKKTCHYGYAIFFIFLTKNIKNQNTLIVHFSHFFFGGYRWWIGMCWGQVLILEYICAYSIPPILLKQLNWGVLWSGFISHWCITRTKLLKPICSWWSIMTTWPLIIEIFLAVFSEFLSFLYCIEYVLSVLA